MSQLNLATFLDAEKYSAAGIMVGVATGAATEFVANVIVETLDIDSTGKPPSLQTLFPDLLVRAMCAGAGYLVASDLYRRMLSGADVSDASMFGFGYITSQNRLFDVTAHAGALLSDPNKVGGWMTGWGVVPLQPACCDDCASGKACTG